MKEQTLRILTRGVSTWETLQSLLRQAKTFLEEKGEGADFIHATTICVSELLENAVKYGAQSDEDLDIDFTMTFDDEVVQVAVANPVKDDESLQKARSIIDKIHATGDPEKLYLERLQEITKETEVGASRLGLYRIAFEGQFDLRYEVKGRIFMVIAERKLSQQISS